MKALVIAAALFFVAPKLYSEELFCAVRMNLETVAETQLTLGSNERVMFAQVGDYVFYITNKNHSKFELEIFDGNNLSRSYAQGVLKVATDDVMWTLWSRDILLETSCKLIQK